MVLVFFRCEFDLPVGKLGMSKQAYNSFSVMGLYMIRRSRLMQPYIIIFCILSWKMVLREWQPCRKDIYNDVTLYLPWLFGSIICMAKLLWLHSEGSDSVVLWSKPELCFCYVEKYTINPEVHPGIRKRWILLVFQFFHLLLWFVK